MGAWHQERLARLAVGSNITFDFDEQAVEREPPFREDLRPEAEE
jgi:hypothetical protein